MKKKVVKKKREKYPGRILGLEPNKYRRTVRWYDQLEELVRFIVRSNKRRKRVKEGLD